MLSESVISESPIQLDINHESDLSQTDSLSRIPRQPREFNPAPERLTPVSQKQSGDDHRSSNSSSLSESNVLANITLRTQHGTPGKSKWSSCVDQGKENSVSVHDTSRAAGCGDDRKTRQTNHQSFQPIRKGLSRSETVLARNEPIRVQEPYKSSQMLSKTSVGVLPKSTSLVSEQRSQGHSMKNTSYASLATEYNDLPDALNITDYSSGERLKQKGTNSNHRLWVDEPYRTSGDRSNKEHAGGASHNSRNACNELQRHRSKIDLSECQRNLSVPKGDSELTGLLNNQRNSSSTKQRLDAETNNDSGLSSSTRLNKQSRTHTRDLRQKSFVTVKSHNESNEQRQGNVASQSRLQQVKNSGMASSLPISRSKHLSNHHHQDSGFHSPYFDQ